MGRFKISYYIRNEYRTPQIEENMANASSEVLLPAAHNT